MKRASEDIRRDNHDTIAMFALDAAGRLFGATSTNGASGKIPGRVGDSPIPGAGLYVLANVGGCGATGDGDVMMRFLPCYQAVESMRLGATPRRAAKDAMARITARYPTFRGGIVVANVRGEHAGASNGGWTFTYSLSSPETNGKVRVFTVEEEEEEEEEPPLPPPPKKNKKTATAAVV